MYVPSAIARRKKGAMITFTGTGEGRRQYPNGVFQGLDKFKVGGHLRSS